MGTQDTRPLFVSTYNLSEIILSEYKGVVTMTGECFVVTWLIRQLRDSCAGTRGHVSRVASVTDTATCKNSSASSRPSDLPRT